MPEVKWIKVSTDMFNANRKIKQIERMPEGDTILVIWLKLMLLAGQINDGGRIYITPEIPYTEEMLAYELQRPSATVKIALSVFEHFGMIGFEDGTMKLSSWEKYQNIDGLEKIREQTRERVAKHREKKRLAAGNVTVTQSNAAEEEKEKETETDQEKENHSYRHSAVFDSGFSENQAGADDRERAKRQFLGGNLGKGVVMLSEEQMNALLDILSAEEFDHYVSVVAQNELQGHKYKRKTHYQAIMDMARQDRRL